MPTLKEASPEPFSSWLRKVRAAQGLTMRDLAALAGTTHPRISQIENGDTPSRDMVERLARALSPDDADEHTARALLNAGLKAAGFAPASDLDYDEHEVIDYLRGKPEPQQDKALKILKSIFDEDDALDNAGNVGKRAE